MNDKNILHRHVLAVNDEKSFIICYTYDPPGMSKAEYDSKVRTTELLLSNEQKHIFALLYR
jgi:hypothetical protein